MPLTKTSTFAFVAILTIGAPASALDDEVSTAESSSPAALSEPINETPAIDPIALDLAAQIVDIGYPEEAREALFFGSMDQTITQLRSSLGPYLPADDPDAVKIFDDWIEKYTAESKTILARHIPAIMDGMAEAYAALFTEAELRDILAFVETPSGKQFFDQMPAVMGQPGFAAANQAYMDESMEVLIPAQRELLDQLKEHQETKGAPTDTT